MPCDSSYLRPSKREEGLQHAAKLLKWVTEYCKMPVPDWLRRGAESCYGDCGDIDPVVALCATMRAFPPELRQELISQPVKESRNLANWWEEHLEADARRETLLAKKIERERLKRAALAKLTAEERKALGL